jgi:hypothetical protein
MKKKKEKIRKEKKRKERGFFCEEEVRERNYRKGEKKREEDGYI